MTENKIYNLPNLPFAPTSDLQLLVRRLMEYADLSTLPAIADELRDQRRYIDLEKFGQLFGDWCSRIVSRPDNNQTIRWRWVTEYLLTLFFIDLYGWSVVPTMFADRIISEEEVFEVTEAMAQDTPQDRLFVATDDIGEGQYGVISYSTSLIRRATPEEIAQQQPQETA